MKIASKKMGVALIALILLIPLSCVARNSLLKLLGGKAPTPYTNVYSVQTNGTSGYLRVTASSEFALGSAGTVSVWTKWSPTMVNFQDLVSCFSSTGTFPGFTFWIIDRKPSLFISDASNNIVTSTGSALSDNTWYHLVVTWSGTLLKFYVDGAQHGADLAISVGAGNSGVDMLIGADTNATPSRFLPGNVDEVSIWSAYMDSSGIAALRSAGRATDLLVHPSRASGVAWWRMGDSTDTLAAIVDRFGNGHTAIPQGSTIVSDVP